MVLDYDRFSSRFAFLTSMENHTYDIWRQREKRFVTADVGRSTLLDWDVGCLKEAKQQAIPREFRVQTDDDILHVPGVKEVVAMWPAGPSSLLSGLGITKSEFNHWVMGRAHLKAGKFSALAALLGIHYSEYDEWEMDGGYLLIATTLATVRKCFDTLSHGGDILYSLEVIGPDGQRPDMRFLVFQAHRACANIILFKRGERAENALQDDRSLVHVVKAHRATPDVWATVLQIVANAKNFKRPEVIGQAFFSKHAAWLEDVSGDSFF